MLIANCQMLRDKFKTGTHAKCEMSIAKYGMVKLS